MTQRPVKGSSTSLSYILVLVCAMLGIEKYCCFDEATEDMQKSKKTGLKEGTFGTECHESVER